MARYFSSELNEFETHALTHGFMSDSTLKGLTDRARDSIRQGTDRSRKFLERTYNEIKSIDLGVIRDKLSAITRRKDDRYMEDTIYRLNGIADFQQAKPSNRRLLMASPRLSGLYRDGLIAGYHGQYEDNEPGRYGRDNIQYREIYSGAYIESDDDDEAGFMIYLDDDLIDLGYNAMSPQEIVNTRDNIDEAEAMIDEGNFDPTNQLGGTI